MCRIRVILFVSSTLLSLCSYVDSADSIDGSEEYNVTIDNFGTITGSTTKTAWTYQTIYQFLSIRYAASPGGKNRFKPPEAVEASQDVIIATSYGNPCPQLRWTQNGRSDKLEEDIEDCLHVSVYTKNVSSSCPVLFFIHGGDFESGGASQYPPNYLLEKDIVLVVPQYRLGPLGFLSTDSKKIPGDAGLLDLVMALNWTQNYIRNFGGDPTKVTMCGHGSGAAIASTFLFSTTMPPNLFHKVIIQSGSLFSPNVFDFNAVENAIAIANYSCEKTEKIEDVTKCFKKMDVNTLLESYEKHKQDVKLRTGLTNYGGASMTYGSLITLAPNEMIRLEGAFKKIPVMFGVVKNEGTNILAELLKWFKDLYGLQHDRLNYYYMLNTIIAFLGSNDVSGTLTAFMSQELFTNEELRSAYYSDMVNGLVDVCGDIRVKGPVFRAAQLQGLHHPSETYLYTYDFYGDFPYLGDSANFANYSGVHHLSDIYHLFPHTAFSTELSYRDTEMAKTMVDLWTSFMKSGVPSCRSISEWPPMNGAFGPYLHINEPSYVGKCFLDEFKVTSEEAHQRVDTSENYGHYGNYDKFPFFNDIN